MPASARRPASGPVANEFETSLTATARCFLNLTDVPCALVWSVSGNARWSWRSAAFRFFLPLPDLPSPASFAARLFGGSTAPSDFAPVAPDAWLDRRDAEIVETLLDHSVFLPNYNAVLTLLWAYRVRERSRAYEEEHEELLQEMNPEDFTLGRQRWPRQPSEYYRTHFMIVVSVRSAIGPAAVGRPMEGRSAFFFRAHSVRAGAQSFGSLRGFAGGQSMSRSSRRRACTSVQDG
jgi:hypothetical protein